MKKSFSSSYPSHYSWSYRQSSTSICTTPFKLGPSFTMFSMRAAKATIPTTKRSTTCLNITHSIWVGRKQLHSEVILCIISSRKYGYLFYVDITFIICWLSYVVQINVISYNIIRWKYCFQRLFLNLFYFCFITCATASVVFLLGSWLSCWYVIGK